jgi:hypothetical protein
MRNRFFHHSVIPTEAAINIILVLFNRAVYKKNVVCVNGIVTEEVKSCVTCCRKDVIITQSGHGQWWIPIKIAECLTVVNKTSTLMNMQDLIRNKHSSHPSSCGQDFLDIKYSVFYIFRHKKALINLRVAVTSLTFIRSLYNSHLSFITVFLNSLYYQLLVYMASSVRQFNLYVSKFNSQRTVLNHKMKVVEKITSSDPF